MQRNVPWKTKDLLPGEIGLRHLVPPIFLESILRTTVTLVNTAFLSRLSDATVSAVSVSTQYINMCTIVVTAIANGSIVCLNQAIGMRNDERSGRLATVAVLANVVMGLLFGLLFLMMSGFFLSIMNFSGDTLLDAQLYMQIVGGAMAISSAETIISSICRSAGRTSAPLRVNLLVNVVNIIGCYLVIFTPWGQSVPGVLGVAVVNVISHICGLSLAVWILMRTSVRLTWKYLRPFPWMELKLAMSIGVPGGMNRVAYSMSQLVTTALISRTGTLMVAAKTYVTNIVHYAALLGQSCAQASELMIGYKLGAGDYDGVMVLRKRISRIALLSNTAFSLLLILLRIPLLKMFTQTEEILAIASGIMMIDFFVEIGRSFNNTLGHSLNACGDVAFQLVVNQCSGWIVSVGGSYLFGLVLGWGLYGVWIAFALDEMTRGMILLWRWRSQKWLEKTKKRRSLIKGGNSK